MYWFYSWLIALEYTVVIYGSVSNTWHTNHNENIYYISPCHWIPYRPAVGHFCQQVVGQSNAKFDKQSRIAVSLHIKVANDFKYLNHLFSAVMHFNVQYNKCTSIHDINMSYWFLCTDAIQALFAYICFPSIFRNYIKYECKHICSWRISHIFLVSV